jgi:hypothetical protein
MEMRGEIHVTALLQGKPLFIHCAQRLRYVMERHREEKDSSKVVRDITNSWEGEGTMSQILKVPRHCALVVLVDIMNVN